MLDSRSFSLFLSLARSFFLCYSVWSLSFSLLNLVLDIAMVAYRRQFGATCWVMASNVLTLILPLYLVHLASELLALEGRRAEVTACCLDLRVQRLGVHAVTLLATKVRCEGESVTPMM